MKIRRDGSIQSNNVPTFNNVQKRQDFGIYRCMVIAAKFADDTNNIAMNSKTVRVFYDVVIIGGLASGQILTNCRLLPQIGGDTGFYERILTPATKSVSGSRLTDQDGDIVFVQFIQGHTGYPIIVGFDNGISNAYHELSGAKIDSTIVLRSLDHTHYKELHKDGTLRESAGFLVGEPAAIDTITNPNEELRTTNFRSGMTITEDGKNDLFEVATSGGTTVLVNGNSNTIEIKSGSATIILDGNSGKISLQGNFIDLGTSVTDFVTKFTALATWANTHTHMVPQTPSGVQPSAPPLMPLLVTASSQTVKVQD